MARPKKTVAPVVDPIEEAITVSKAPIEGVVVETVEQVVVVAATLRQDKINSLSRLFPKAPFETYDDDLIDALYTQHIGTMSVTV